jgi:predicted RNA binding protein YcfA (HicA-like mRNA interferase family)
VSVAKTLRRLLSGTSDAAIRFDDLCSLLQSLGFDKRVKGSHPLFRKSGVEERINLQREGNTKAVPGKAVRAVGLLRRVEAANSEGGRGN